MAERFTPHGEPTTSRRGAFWVGLDPVEGPVGTVMRGPMFVEWEAPVNPRPGPPWVLVHGGGGQATDYTVTPDGRPGWSRLLVEQGHTVYVVDRPGHGRSPHHPDVLGPMGPQLGYQFLRPIFVPPPDGPDSNPAAHLHTRWPGGRDPSDPVYAQCLCTSGPMLADQTVMHELEQRRLAELLEMVGPAVVVTHSAGGPGAFAGVDAAAEHVAAFVAIETLGPPFVVLPEMGLDMTRYGLSCAPIAYDPPLADGDALDTVTEVRDEFGEIPLTLQADPPRRLANLSRFPIAVVTAEASMFLAYDRHLVAYLEQCGCDVELVRLAEHGVHGNGHAMMLELGHDEPLAVITGWVEGKLAGSPPPPAGEARAPTA